MLTRRLQDVMDFLVDNNQVAFVPGRIITDNVLLAHELVKGYGRKGISPRCILKIDIQKAYDSVEWTFLEQVLIGLNFLAFFIKWIMTYVRIVSYSIVINGTPTPSFPAKKRVRQGDPMSPFLYVLAMEYITRLLHTLKEKPNFNFHSRCSKLNIIQVEFADDLLLFCRGDVTSILMLFKCFRLFSEASGLFANIWKSSVYFGVVPPNKQHDIN